MKIFNTIAAAALAVAALAVGASAATIATGTKSVEITCTGSCEFWDLGLDPDGFNPDSGDWLTAAYGGITNNSSSSRLDFVNNVLGTSFVSQSETSDADLIADGVPAISGFSGGDNGGWTGSAQFYLAWGGFDPRYVLIRNGTVDNVFTWTATGQGSGLSGVDGFGVIPLPAAGWLLLAGIGGMAALRRRKES